MYFVSSKGQVDERLIGDGETVSLQYPCIGYFKRWWNHFGPRCMFGASFYLLRFQ